MVYLRNFQACFPIGAFKINVKTLSCIFYLYVCAINILKEMNRKLQLAL